MKESEKILFGYSCTPSCGFEGENDGGFSIELDINGILLYKTYLFDFIEQTRSTTQLSAKTVKGITDILERYTKIIARLSPNLNNGSCDGYCNQFIFSGKEIVSWNIQYTNRLTAVANPVYYIEYGRNIKQENTVLSIFELITEKLKYEGITLALNKVCFSSKTIKGNLN